tara:strand:+ start:1175 stop:1651 length:477 start_codon:yes stop_codon:yes gene_type:complete
MIQAITETTIYANLSTEDNRINTTLSKQKIYFLVKLINDMDGSVSYCYPTKEIYNRYTNMRFVYAVTPDMFKNEINLLPAGYWKYEVYEVSWIGEVSILELRAPATETDVLPVSDDNGVVQGIVTKGKLNLSEKIGTEQVQYVQRQEPSETNYIYYGQ